MKNTVGEALFPQVKRQLLGLLFSATGPRHYGREIARLINVSYGTVVRELKTLVDAGILISEKEGPHTYYRANPDCAVYDELTRLVTKTFGLKDVLAAALGTVGEKIQIAAVFGSLAKGDATGSSDVDVLIVGEVTLRELVGALDEAEHVITRSVNPVLYSPSEFTRKYHESHHFVRSLMGTELMFIIGNNDELKSLVEKEVA